MMEEIITIKSDGELVESNYNVEEVENLTQIIAELELIKFYLLGEYFKRGGNK